MAELDHLVLDVNDREESVEFYTDVLGFADEGRDGPFSVIRINASTTLLLGHRATEGGVHLAFALALAEFEATFRRLRELGIAYGDAFNTVGSSRGPGDETGARGMGKAIYFFDPNRHLLEIRHYVP